MFQRISNNTIFKYSSLVFFVLFQHTTPSSPTQPIITTRKNVVKNYTYSVSRSVIIAVSACVGFIIITVIILAICCVRHRMRFVI